MLQQEEIQKENTADRVKVPLEISEKNPAKDAGWWRHLSEPVVGKLHQLFGNEKSLQQKRADELARLERVRTFNGVNFSRCQIAEIAKAYRSGGKIDLEGFHLYVSDGMPKTVEELEKILTDSDKVSLAAFAELTSLLPGDENHHVRKVGIIDDEHSLMPDTENITTSMVTDEKTRRESTDIVTNEVEEIDEEGNVSYKTIISEKANRRHKMLLRGAPTMNPHNIKKNEITHIKYSEAYKEHSATTYNELLRKHGIVKEGDREGIDMLTLSENAKFKDAEILVDRLRKDGLIKEKGKEIFFVNPQAENPEFEEIKLKKRSGEWTCEALDAASFLKPENLEITHLIVLPEYFKNQQDRVWEILRVLGIKHDHYHNIFLQAGIDPETAAATIRQEFRQYLESEQFKKAA